MRLHAIILAVCVCAHHTRAASLPLPDRKLDLDDVNLDDDRDNDVKEDNLRNTNEVIPVKVVEEQVIDENSNDYIPPFDTSITVKRVEVDLANPGPPQRQEHETQNPENFSDNDKIIVSIKNTIKQAENVFNEGLKGVSDSFKTFLQANEDLPAIQQNIKNLKDTFTSQIDKLNETIRTYLKPETSEGAAHSKIEIVQARLKFLDNNFRLGLDTLTEGVEVYSIIKEEDEAEKAIALKADVKAEPEVAPSKPVDKPEPAKPVPEINQPPATVAGSPWNTFFSNWQNSVSAAFSNINNAMSGIFSGNNNDGQYTQTQSSNPIQGIFQGINFPNIFQNTGNQVPSAEKPSGQGQPTKPSDVQADPVPAPPAPWSPQGILQSVTSTWNNIVNPGQNNQPQPLQDQQNVAPQPANTNPFQQAIQNIVSFITPQPPQAQQPVNPVNPSPPVAPPAPEKAPQSATQPEAAVQGGNVVPAPVNDQSQPQAQPSQVNPAPAQAGPIQQLVQNNPIIKGIQNAVQRIQGPPNPETPREEVVQESQNKEEFKDPKGHFHGGFESENNVTNQGDSSGDSGRIEDKVQEEKVQSPLYEEKEILDEQLKPEELKTPEADKTE